MLVKVNAHEELTPVEQIRVTFFLRTMLFNFEWEYRQYEEDKIEKIPLSGWREAIRLRGHGPRVWRSIKPTLLETSPNFVKYMEENVISQLE